MGTKTLKALIIAALAAALTSTSSPAHAGSTSITDSAGVDYTWSSNPITDLRAVSLGFDGSAMTASWTVGGPLPAPGSTSPTGGMEVRYEVLFQNLDKQTGGDNSHGGCTTITGGRKPDKHGSWQDGFHFVIAVDLRLGASGWEYSAAVREYDPDPGFDGGSFWHSPPAPISVSGSTVTVQVPGVVESPDVECWDGTFKTAYMTTGDDIIDVKGASTFSQPLTLRLTADFGALSTVGSFFHLSDVTAGNSTAGLFARNKPGISYTPGLTGSDAIRVLGGHCPSIVGVPRVLCYVDDDAVSRGSFFAEWWDTPYGFTA